jgi:4-hydroxybenzoate polyprenyltransferase
MDSDELAGDTKAGIRTLAAILGQRRTMRGGATLMFLSAAVVSGIVRGPVARCAAMATLALLALVFAWPGLSDSRRIQLSRFPMLLGSIALACGGG